MLTTCWECEQVIEIRQVEEHLLEECPNKDRYRFCGKCRQVLLAAEIDESAHDCAPPQNQSATRCPLCTAELFPNEPETWQQHLCHECTGNPRSAAGEGNHAAMD